MLDVPNALETSSSFESERSPLDSMTCLWGKSRCTRTRKLSDPTSRNMDGWEKATPWRTTLRTKGRCVVGNKATGVEAKRWTERLEWAYGCNQGYGRSEHWEWFGIRELEPWDWKLGDPPRDLSWDESGYQGKEQKWGTKEYSKICPVPHDSVEHLVWDLQLAPYRRAGPS